MPSMSLLSSAHICTIHRTSDRPTTSSSSSISPPSHSSLSSSCCSSFSPTLSSSFSPSVVISPISSSYVSSSCCSSSKANNVGSSLGMTESDDTTSSSLSSFSSSHALCSTPTKANMREDETDDVIQLLDRSIDFVRSTSKSHWQLKWMNNNSNSNTNTISVGESINSSASPNPHFHENHDRPLPEPDEWFYDPDNLSPLRWKKQQPAGAGLENPGINICFMNATLQALTYAPGFADDLLEEIHSKRCIHRRQGTFCALCHFEKHVKSVLSTKGSIQNRIYMWVQRLIWRKYHIGRQEDAHEFLRFFMDSLNRGSLPPDKQNEEVQRKMKDVEWMTTYISQQFGGWYKSSIRCAKCGYVSNKYDPCLDFTMEIIGVSSIEKAFARFVQPEDLSGSNRYMSEA